MRTNHLGGVAILLFAGIAGAQVSPTGPFVGSASEPFDSIVSPGFNLCLQMRVFGGTADLCTFDPNTGLPSGGTSVPTGWSFGCNMFPYAGSKFYGSANGTSDYTFDAPVTKFGGYFGINYDPAIPAGFDVTFYDAGGAMIGATQHANFSTCAGWEWHGWELTTPAKRIRVHGVFFNGPFVMMDSMEVDSGSSCYPDCDGDGSLTLADFGCFQTKFALGDPYADCNGDTQLNLADFGCFQTQYALGCP